MQTTTKTTDSLSKPVENFKQWIEGWDLEIESMDDFDSRKKIENILAFANVRIGKHIGDWEEKLLQKDIDNGANSWLEFRETDQFKDFQRMERELLWLQYKIKDLFELKNRRTKENFELRAEIAILKQKLNSTT